MSTLLRSRIVLERELVARLLSEAQHDGALLGRRLQGLALAGIGETEDGCWLSRILAALRRLAGTSTRIELPVVAAEAGVDAEELAWVADAYDTNTPLYSLVVLLLDARRRGLGRSVAAVLDHAMCDAGTDVDQAIATALTQLRRLRDLNRHPCRPPSAARSATPRSRPRPALRMKVKVL